MAISRKFNSHFDSHFASWNGSNRFTGKQQTRSQSRLLFGEAALTNPLKMPDLVKPILEKSDDFKLAMACSLQGMDKQQALLKIFNPPYKSTILSRKPIIQIERHQTPEDTLKRLAQATPIALGDLHASVRKLVETLVMTNLVEMPFETAQTFVTLTDKLDQKQSIEGAHVIKAALEKLIPHMKWIGGKRQLILMGDTLSDRGPLDSLTMDIIQYLRKQAKNPEAIIVLASNHDHHALNFIRTGENYLPDLLCRSLLNDMALAATSKDTESMPKLWHKYYDYLKQTKLLYLDADKTLYTHARVTDAHIQKLTTLLRDCPQKLPSLVNLTEKWTLEKVKIFIGKANSLYQKHVKDEMEQCDCPEWPKQPAWKVKLEQFLVGDKQSNKTRPGFLWTRKPYEEKAELPFSDSSLKALVHGHAYDGKDCVKILHGEPLSQGHYSVFNLDQQVRKGSLPILETRESILFTPSLPNGNFIPAKL